MFRYFTSYRENQDIKSRREWNTLKEVNTSFPIGSTAIAFTICSMNGIVFWRDPTWPPSPTNKSLFHSHCRYSSTTLIDIESRKKIFVKKEWMDWLIWTDHQQFVPMIGELWHKWTIEDPILSPTTYSTTLFTNSSFSKISVILKVVYLMEWKSESEMWMGN